jgi:hypothetical protein
MSAQTTRSATGQTQGTAPATWRGWARNVHTGSPVRTPIRDHRVAIPSIDSLHLTGARAISIGVTIAAAVMLTVGAGIRVGLYLTRPTVTLDEAMLAVNILGPHGWALLRPLALEQTAPVLFLAFTRAATTLFGPTEYALRSPFLRDSCSHR